MATQRYFRVPGNHVITVSLGWVALALTFAIVLTGAILAFDIEKIVGTF